MCTERYDKRYAHTQQPQQREPEPASTPIVAGETVGDETATIAAEASPIGAAPGSEA